MDVWMSLLVLLLLFAATAFMGFEVYCFVRERIKRKRIKERLEERKNQDVIEHEDKED